jgi:hypothetical protein
VVAGLDQLRNELTARVGSALTGFPRVVSKPGKGAAKAPAASFNVVPRRFPRLVIVLVLGLGAACDRPAVPTVDAAPAAVPAPATPADTARNVVDSILPVEEEIRRFRAQLSEPLPTGLEHAAESLEQLVSEYLTALETRDAGALNKLVLSPGEFIELYYPHSQYTRPPYRQSPAFVWFLFEQNSNKGMTRALNRFGGRSLGHTGSECKPREQQEKNRFWECALRLGRGTTDTASVRLFGTIIERAGRFKFVSYASDL